MTVRDKFSISRMLLQETADFIPNDNRDLSSPFLEMIDAIDEYLDSGELEGESENEADRISFGLLIDTINSCLPHLMTQFEMRSKGIRRKRKPKREIESSLARSLDDLDGDAQDMNINEWMEENGYVEENEFERKVKERNERKDSSSQ